MGNIRNNTLGLFLAPISFVYKMVTSIRNYLFDWGILNSQSFNIPIINIGNLAVGGTGKTPHTEYLVCLLKSEGLNVAVLSRGYKRKSRGFVVATNDSTALEIGDEPWQIKKKHPDIVVAVDTDRRHGIENIMKFSSPRVDVIIMDDAFQHRYVKAGMNILLTDKSCLYCDDWLLPSGRLRESKNGAARAQIIIVTKCFTGLTVHEAEDIEEKLSPLQKQELFFSAIEYDEVSSLTGYKTGNSNTSKAIDKNTRILLLTGIANPKPLENHVREITNNVVTLSFPDHHNFTANDINIIKEQFSHISGNSKVILTTEKDAARLLCRNDIDNNLKESIMVMPIRIKILHNKQDTFNHKIIDYVRENSRDS